MKSVLFLILNILCLKAISGEGIILKYNTFLYNRADQSSKKVKLLRKGQKIFLHDKYFHHKRNDLSNLEFLETVDQNGNNVFIKRNDIKLIYNDSREEEIANNESLIDNSDYRSPEPLSPRFPFYLQENYRGMFNLGYYSNGNITKYNYLQNTIKENIGLGGTVEFSVFKRANWDTENRFFIGGTFSFTSIPSRYQLSSNFLSTELNTTFQFGPSVSYDFFRKNHHYFTVIGTLALNYHKYFVNIENLAGAFEERKFSSFTISPTISFLWQKMVTTSEFNFFTGIKTQLTPSHNLTPSNPPVSFNLWNSSNDNVQVKTSLAWSIVIGISNHF